MEYRRKIGGRVITAGVVAAVMISMVSLVAGSRPVYANSNENEEKNQVVVDENHVLEEEMPDGTPFSVPGNAELLDDVTDDDSKQFITVRTKNNQTFFVVIDRQNSAENVYMLSMIDENDLEKFLDDGDKKKNTLSIPEKTETVEPTAQVETEVKSNEKRSKSMGDLMVAIGLIILIVGLYYFIRIRPKKRHGSSRDDFDRDEDEEYEEDDEYEEDKDDEEDKESSDDSQEDEADGSGADDKDEKSE